MINHSWSLLANLPPGTPEAVSEYVSLEFQPRERIGPLRTVDALLFGSAPDSTYRRLKTQQYVRFLCSPISLPYLEQLDPRVTHCWRADQFSDSSAYSQLTVTPRNSATDTLRVYGVSEVDDAAGQSRFDWLIEVIDGNDVPPEVVYDGERPVWAIKITPLRGAAQYMFVESLGSTTRVSDLGRGLRFQILSAVGAFSDHPAEGQAWDVAAVALPRRGLADTLRLLDNSFDAVSSLPYSGSLRTTFDRMRAKSNIWPVRLAGSLLLFLYSLEA